jgi:cephalosporin hydroxylase
MKPMQEYESDFRTALSLAHSILKPRFYLEIGCRRGSNLALAKCQSLAIDPDFEITSELAFPTRIFKETSDDFFNRPNPGDLLGSRIDLAFIDGAHRVEFALRDFINLEKHGSKNLVILIHNVLPQDIAGTTRRQEGQSWTGDVYRLVPILREYRPDLVVQVFDIGQKGLAVVSSFAPANDALRSAYPQIDAQIKAGAYGMQSVEEIRHRLSPLPAAAMGAHLQSIADSFPQRPFESSIRGEFLKHYQRGVLGYTYRGVPCFKSPIDLAIYLKLIWELKPRTIIEVGTKAGGSALLWADILAIYGFSAHVYSIDLDPARIADERISFLAGDVHDLLSAFDRNGIMAAPRPWLVTEDSAHTYDGCLAALRYLSTVMAAGDVLVMEDGNLAELGLEERYQGGPSRAIAEFMTHDPGRFEVLSSLCDLFGPNATYNPNGYLRKT